VTQSRNVPGEFGSKVLQERSIAILLRYLPCGALATMKLIEYFDRTCIINLPEQTGRLSAIRKELGQFGSDACPAKVQVPFAPRPTDPNGFISKGVYGSFLSHLEILKQAAADHLESVWVLEDDATFSRRMVREQEQLVAQLERDPWGLCFFGHSLLRELAGMPDGLVPTPGDLAFRWSHCYAVRSGTLSRLIEHLEGIRSRPAGDPRGGKMYVDGAFNWFRKSNPDVLVLSANPVMSIQRGSRSGLGKGWWYDDRPVLKTPLALARWTRDEIWRRTGFLAPSGVKNQAIAATTNKPQNSNG
jgi:glycosyl transferase, family 25